LNTVTNRWLDCYGL